MSLQAYPTDVKEQFAFLVGQAERYIKQDDVGPRAFRVWRNRALDWLKQNAPTSGLPDALVVVTGRNIQRGLRVLLRARPVVPFLRDAHSVAPPSPRNTKKVFIVHGRDGELKYAVAHLVSRLGLEPVILHEQPNKGRTVIEKLFDHSDVGFAVVLLSADDKGGLANESPDSYKFRARQNVIMELGLFLGRLGRERVAAIYESGVEMPSDYSGVLFLPYDDAGAWQHALAHEIRSAGLPVKLGSSNN
jgi:CAP12/Pycsar effector protein, TIR domain